MRIGVIGLGTIGATHLEATPANIARREWGSTPPRRGQRPVEFRLAPEEG